MTELTKYRSDRPEKMLPLEKKENTGFKGLVSFSYTLATSRTDGECVAIMLGYLNRPEANAETLFTDADGTWLRTGDIGFVDHDGYHYITDRSVLLHLPSNSKTDFDCDFSVSRNWSVLPPLLLRLIDTD